MVKTFPACKDKECRVRTLCHRGNPTQPGNLLVEAHVRPADIAFLRPDQDAKVKLTACDYAIYAAWTLNSSISVPILLPMKRVKAFT